MGAIAEVFGARQAELNQSIGQRLDAMTGRIGQTMTSRPARRTRAWPSCRSGWPSSTRRRTTSSRWPARWCSCRRSCPTSRRAAPSASRAWKAIVADGCRMGAYEFQATLSNGSRPDCLVRMPNGAPPLVIDAKFPLEAWNAIRAAEEGSTDAQGARRASLPARHGVHIRDDCGEIPDHRRDAGHGLHVRAVGIDLRRDPREFRRRSCSARTARASSSCRRRC
jgi:DNA recombination protein RmuC